MKSILKSLAVAAIAAAALNSCSSEEPFEVRGEGTVFISASLNADVKPESRATLDELKADAMIWISNEKGLVRNFNSPAQIPAEGIKLVAGNYVAEAWAGDSVPASFDDRYFTGYQPFTVTSGAPTEVKVTCKIANSVVAVNYDARVDDVLSEYTMTVGHSQGELVFEGKDERKGYFMMNSRDHDLAWTLKGKKINGDEFTRSGVIEACKPATLYSLNVKCTEADTEIGGAYLVIEVDETMVDVKDEILIVAAPTIAGYNFDINEELRAEPGLVGRRSLYVTASSAMTAVSLSCPVFGDMLGIGENEFEFFAMEEAARNLIESKGINYDYIYDADADASTIKINFEEIFTNALPVGEYDIKVSVEDANGKKAEDVMRIVISDAPVLTGICDPATVWTNRATITGEIAKASALNPVLKYRKLGVSAWTVAQTSVSGTELTANLSGLEANTQYEFVAATDDFESSEIGVFTTEEARQLPNAGFEDWCMSGKVQMISASASDYFWHSGNAASGDMMGVNLTTPSSDVKHSGNYSACLKSQFVGVGIIGAFAAGNLFVGDFIGTEDGTNGILGWGRTWNSRPAKLKGYVKYAPATVDYYDSACTSVVEGGLDKGTIYIALLNDALQDYDGKKYPVVIRTSPSKRQLFDKNGSNVIAYGEVVYDAATSGDGLIPFEIPLVYNRTDVKPSYILCTASASIGGDYFTGGAGSTMYLDDLELVYE